MDRFYDLTQLDAVKGFVVDEAILTPAELRSRLRSIRLHPALRTEGRGRARRAG
jgi:hypothetical protein